MYRFEAVTSVWQSPADDDRHGVVEEGTFHLFLDLDGGHLIGLVLVIEIHSWNISHVGSFRSPSSALRVRWSL